MNEKTRTQKVIENIETRKKTFESKNADYGESYVKSGMILESIFPDGIQLKTWRDHCSYQIVIRKLDKILRYLNLRFVAKDQKVKSEKISDTLGDDAIYSFMLAELEEEENGEDTEQNS